MANGCERASNPRLRKAANRAPHRCGMQHGLEANAAKRLGLLIREAGVNYRPAQPRRLPSASSSVAGPAPDQRSRTLPRQSLWG